MKKAATVFPVSEIKDIDIEKKNFDEGLLNKTYSLLSSGCKSPPLLKFDDSQDLQELDGWNISVQDHFSSVLSLSETSGCLPMFDGSRVSPIHEASWVLDRQWGDIGQKHFQEKVNTWLHNMDGKEVTDSCFVCLESGNSSYTTSSFEESFEFESSCTSLATYDCSPSFVQEVDRTDKWDSLLDLEGDDSEFDNGENGFDSLGSDFPSPSFGNKRCFLIKPPASGSVQIEEAKSLSEKFAADEPLFWPFDSSSYRSPEFDHFLCMSPRKDGLNLERQHITRSKLISSGLHEKNHPPVFSNNIPRCRKALFSLTPTLDCRNRVSNNKDVKKVSRPSRLSKPTKALGQLLRSISINQKARRPENRDKNDWMCKRLLELEDSQVRSSILEGVPIEKVVGLNEFDGHEGIDVKFDAYNFNLPGTPYMKASH